MLTAPHSPPPTRVTPIPWSPMVGHALTVIALALGGLSSFHALRAEVVELRSNLNALMNLEAEHSRRAETGRDETDHGDNTFTGNAGVESTFDESILESDYEQLSGGDNGLDEGTLI